jgi:hypothetical protein
MLKQSERVAQAVEHVTFNHGVEGSSPSALTKQNQLLIDKKKPIVRAGFFVVHRFCVEQAACMEQAARGCPNHRHYLGSIAGTLQQRTKRKAR